MLSDLQSSPWKSAVLPGFQESRFKIQSLAKAISLDSGFFVADSRSGQAELDICPSYLDLPRSCTTRDLARSRLDGVQKAQILQDLVHLAKSCKISEDLARSSEKFQDLEELTPCNAKKTLLSRLTQNELIVLHVSGWMEGDGRDGDGGGESGGRRDVGTQGRREGNAARLGTSAQMRCREGTVPASPIRAPTSVARDGRDSATPPRKEGRREGEEEGGKERREMQIAEHVPYRWRAAAAARVEGIGHERERGPRGCDAWMCGVRGGGGGGGERGGARVGGGWRWRRRRGAERKGGRRELASKCSCWWEGRGLEKDEDERADYAPGRSIHGLEVSWTRERTQCPRRQVQGSVAAHGGVVGWIWRARGRR
ncbi:hypothetical protein C8R47DRAFT_1083164 [Mycena vitilis]|nr:hypothetical protein C8R47DRAFT_1083164 [Mycena vitilis]